MSRSTRPPALRLLAVLLLACGCQGPGARYVWEGEHAGVVGIPNNTDIWPTYYRTKAIQLMTQKCPDGYEITGEETVTVRSGAPGGANDNPRWEYTGGLERVPEQTEHQISFRCAPAPAAPPPAPAAPP